MPVAQLRLEANVVMISIASVYIYNNRTDILRFLALSTVYKSKLIESIIQIENVIQNFVLKYSKGSFFRIVFCEAGFFKMGSRSKS